MNEKTTLAPKPHGKQSKLIRGYPFLSTTSEAKNKDKSVDGISSTCLSNEKPRQEFMAKHIPKIFPEGKIDAKPVVSFDRIMKRIDDNKDDFLPENKVIMRRFIYEARLGKTLIGREKKKIGEKRLMKYLQDLKKLDIYFKKPFTEINEQDFERFIIDLETGILKSNRGTEFAPETQSAMKKLVIKFYRWLEGESIETPKKLRWVDTSCELPEFIAVKKPQVDTMLGWMTSNTTLNLARNRAIIIVLFDAGVRAEELLNIRLRNIELEDNEYVVRIEHSKTTKRTIVLPFSKQLLDFWLDIHPLKDNPSAQLFPVSYNALRSVVRRAGDAIGVKLTPHHFRHSSATYWCQKLTPYELCYRFGWSMSSRSPQRYIDRSGLGQKKASKLIKAAKMSELQEENASLSSRLSAMEKQFKKFFETDYKEARRIIEVIKGQSL